MKMNNDQATGKLKQAAGILTDDDKLKNEGKVDQMAGDAKIRTQDIADDVINVIDDIKDAVTKN
jgi:uncharacterized protein YjbJ (UPF0337 family)